MYSRADDYRRRAFEAQQQAAQAPEERLRELLQDVAANWFELADLLDRRNRGDQQIADQRRKAARTVSPQEE
jgi:hypothetical protein